MHNEQEKETACDLAIKVIYCSKQINDSNAFGDLCTGMALHNEIFSKQNQQDQEHLAEMEAEIETGVLQ